MKTNVLVLGATGFVGRRLIALLARSDWAVPVAASRTLAPGSDVAGVRTLRLEATDPKEMTVALGSVEAVVNCIAGDPADIASGAEVLAQCARARGGGLQVVHMSSLAVYGSTRGTVDETAPVRTDSGAYGAAKVAAERALSAYPDATILRPGIIYGPGSHWWTQQIARLLRSGRLGDLGEAGLGFCNLVHVDDVASVAAAVIRRGPQGASVFNLSTPAPVTWNDYYAQFSAALGTPGIRRISALRLAAECHLVGPPLRAAELICNRFPTLGWTPPPAIRPWLLALCRHDIYMSVERIRAQLGFSFTPLSDGLRATASALTAIDREHRT